MLLFFFVALFYFILIILFYRLIFLLEIYFHWMSNYARMARISVKCVCSWYVLLWYLSAETLMNHLNTVANKVWSYTSIWVLLSAGMLHSVRVSRGGYSTTSHALVPSLRHQTTNASTGIKSCTDRWVRASRFLFWWPRYRLPPCCFQTYRFVSRKKLVTALFSLLPAAPRTL